MEWIKFVISSLFLISGIFSLIMSMYGVYKYDYVLNRMQSAAIGDTLGITLCMIGLIIVVGFNLTALKFLLVIVFLWISSPVSSHLISRLEVKTNPKIYEDCEVMGE